MDDILTRIDERVARLISDNQFMRDKLDLLSNQLVSHENRIVILEMKTDKVNRQWDYFFDMVFKVGVTVLLCWLGFRT